MPELLSLGDGASLRRTYKYRAYPTRAQTEALERQLGLCCDLYNAALEQRRSAWRAHSQSPSLYDQMRDLTEISRVGWLEGMNVHAARDPLKRLDRAFRAFFRRVKRGEKAGYPRFRSRARYDSLTWPMGNGAGLRDGRLRLQGVGCVRVRWHREIPAASQIREVSVKRCGSHWYACFSVEIIPEPLAATGESVGLDLGVSTFAALSTGKLIEGPRAFQRARRELRVAQRRVARRKQGSHRRRKAAAVLARKHERLRNVRRDHAHKTARGLVERFDLIAVEDLNVRGLARSRLARDVHDQGWAQFVALLRDKAEEAGREVVLVDPRGTSQACSECGGMVPKSLSQRVHRCGCGYVADRDVNAARNILARGLGRSLQASTVGEEVHAVA